MSRATSSDTIGGVLLLVCGIAVVAYVSATYPLGTMFRMGPGMFPMLLGGLLTGLGLVVVATGIVRPLAAARIDVRPFTAVIGSMVAFAIAFPLFGLIPAIVLLILVSAYADEKPNILTSLALAAFLAVLVVLIFRVGLGIRMPLVQWPWA